MVQEHEIQAAERLLKLIGKASCPYTAKTEVCRQLEEAGFEMLDFRAGWQVKPGGKYYVSPYETSVFAFRVGEDGNWRNIRIAASHIDSPALRVKYGPELKDGRCRKLSVEPYGGGIWNTWLDRQLSIAGAVTLKGKCAFAPKVVKLDWSKPLCVIPNRAFHLNRTVNDGAAIKALPDLLPVIGTEPLSERALLDVIAMTLSVRAEDILNYDLYLYNCERGAITGLDQSMIVSPRIDNLSSVGAMLYGLANTECRGGIDVACFFDHEEIGSRTKNGADSAILPVLLERLAGALGKSRGEYLEGMAGAFFLSVDVAHADHPNHRELTDAATGMALGDGVAIKAHAKQSYSTDPFSAGVVQSLCEAAGVPCKINYPHSNAVSGSTVGPILSAGLAVEAADIGMPILAMHSAVETGAVKDYAALEQLLKAYYSVT